MRWKARSRRTCLYLSLIHIFFLPLAGAVLHLAVAFKLMAKLLEIMYLTNVPLFAACTGVTILVFVVFYAIVFAVTSREYYKIVR